MVNITYNYDYYQFNQWYLFALVDIVVKILLATTQKMFFTPLLPSFGLD